MPYPNLPANPVAGAVVDDAWGTQVAAFIRALGGVPTRRGEILWTPNGSSIDALGLPSSPAFLRNDQNGNLRWDQFSPPESWAERGGGNVPLSRQQAEMVFESRNVLPATGPSGQFAMISSRTGSRESLNVTNSPQPFRAIFEDSTGLYGVYISGSDLRYQRIDAQNGTRVNAYRSPTGIRRSSSEYSFALTSSRIFLCTGASGGGTIVRVTDKDDDVGTWTDVPNPTDGTNLDPLAIDAVGETVWGVFSERAQSPDRSGARTGPQVVAADANSKPTVRVYSMTASRQTWNFAFSAELGEDSELARNIDIAADSTGIYIQYHSGGRFNSPQGAFQAFLTRAQFSSAGASLGTESLTSGVNNTLNAAWRCTAYDTVFRYGVMQTSRSGSTTILARTSSAQGSVPPGTHLYQSDGTRWVYRARMGGEDAAVDYRLAISDFVSSWAMAADQTQIPWSKISAAVQANVNVSGFLNQSRVDARVRALVQGFAQTGNSSRLTLGRLPISLLTGAEIDSNGRLVLRRNGGNPVVLALPSGNGGGGNQTLSLSGRRLSISDGNSVTLPAGGLDRAAVDARVRAGVNDWAETNNTDPIPASKLTNAPSRGGGLSTVSTDSTINGNGSSGSPLTVANPFTAADEAKLDGIQAGAEVNVQADWNATSGDAVIRNKPVIPVVPARAGAFTAADEAKLDGIQAGAEVNVQADWNATAGDAAILNKPTIPTVPARAGAFTEADETKLDGIEAGAQVNPDISGIAANARALGGVSLWIGTQAEYDAISSPNRNTVYFLRPAGDTGPGNVQLESGTPIQLEDGNTLQLEG